MAADQDFEKHTTGDSKTRSESVLYSAQLSQQAKRKRLYYLFQKYDEDVSGSLDAGEVCTLLSDMGHGYPQEEVQAALSQVAGVATAGGGSKDYDSAINFGDFCEWWECLDFFHEQGIWEGALLMASVKYKKGSWLEEVQGLLDDMLVLQLEQSSGDHQPTISRFQKQYAEDEEEMTGSHPGNYRPSNVTLSTANLFFEYTQKEISGKAKAHGSLLLAKRPRKPSKYLDP